MAFKIIKLPYKGILLIFLLSLGSTVSANDLQEAQRAFKAGEYREALMLLRPLVREGMPDAQFLLAEMYEQGLGLNVNKSEANRLYGLAAAQGHDQANIKYHPPVKNASTGADSSGASKVLDWYLPAAKEGDTEAQYNLAYMYETGLGVDANQAKARKWYFEAAELQHDVAQMRLGMMMITGTGGEKAVNDGIDMLEKAAANGNRIAEIFMQELFDAGDMDRKASVEIVNQIRQISAEDGEQKIITQLQKQIEVLRKNKPSQAQTKPVERAPEPRSSKSMKSSSEVQAIDVLDSPENNLPPLTSSSSEQMPKNNNVASDAQFNLGKVFDLGLGVAKNDAEMVRWYQASAEKGNADAQLNLGILYVQGRGVNKDMEQGLAWFRKAAEQGHQLAQNYLQLWDNKFSVGEVNNSVALSWLTDAARAWNLDAIYNLGFLYESGRGVSVNMGEAMKWYRLAALQGHNEARTRLAFLQKGGAPVAQSVEQQLVTSKNIKVNNANNILIGSIVLGVALLAIIIYFLRFRVGKFNLPNPLNLAQGKKSNPSQTTVEGIPKGGISSNDMALLTELWSHDKPADLSQMETNHPPPTAPPVDTKAESVENKREVVNGIRFPSLDDVTRETSQVDVGGKGMFGETIEQALAADSKGVAATNEPKQATPDVESKPKPQVPASPIESESIETNDTDFIERRKQSRSLSADLFNMNNISQDALASSRVSADNLFGIGYAIDPKGKVRKSVDEPQRVKADEFLENFQENSNSWESSSPIKEQDLQSFSGQAFEFNDSDAKSQFRPNREKSDQAKLAEEQQHLHQKLKASIAKQQEKNHATQSKVELPPMVEAQVPAESPIDLQMPVNGSHSLSDVHVNIANMFAQGRGVPKNDMLAAKWYRKAATEGSAEAQYQLAQMYFDGRGVGKDSEQAEMWLRKSADAGYKPAKELLEKKYKAG